MMLAERTLAFAAQAPGLQTRKALGASLLALVETIGAQRYACLYVRREADGVAIERSISNVPRQWQEVYLERGFDAADPIFKGALRGGSFGFWTEITAGMRLDRSEREVMGVAREFDMKDGFTKRVVLDSGGVAIVMVAGEELVKSERSRASLRMAFDVFANEGARLLRVVDGSELEVESQKKALSRTQLKVLMMRSEGLTNQAVASAMGRHEKTIECHVTEILRRLDARNMIDAIRIATRMKLIM
jgi:DNA-binding CsgD family transcriptional regulator